ncbi:hypothetical protein MLD38_019215 [Melastoma candidum]|uniref:Uncharacterized protein n=1 Tax=Melastoma candidum TaxID=119954 RepID=A0ACB9R0B8_9MYRT|nr:hypothetical protein MLD38_019215 [Melastoma candidum]
MDSYSRTYSSPSFSKFPSSTSSPRSSSVDPSWVGWFSSSTSISLPEFTPIPSFPSDVTSAHFSTYLSSLLPLLLRFSDIRSHSLSDGNDAPPRGDDEDGVPRSSVSDPLAAALRAVPAFFFRPDFSLEDGTTFRSACPEYGNFTLAEKEAIQERLGGYLDVVEGELVREIGVRMESFFEAQLNLEELSKRIEEGSGEVRVLRDRVKGLEREVVGGAEKVKELSKRRTRLVGLQGALRLILTVNQALSALKLLVASADCAGALDIIDDLQHLLEGDELAGLHCFRHLRDHVAASVESINNILSAEFLRASVHNVGDLDIIILSRAKAKASISTNGIEKEVKLDNEETSNLQDHLLPVVVGLLRTAKLPSVLRVYRDMLTADMKTAIKNTVADLLPILVARHAEANFSEADKTADGEGGASSLAGKLRSLTSESFVELLDAIFGIVRVHLIQAAEVKKAIEWIMCNLDDQYAANSVATAITLGEAATISGLDSDGQSGSKASAERNVVARLPSFPGRTNDFSSPAVMSKNFRVDVLRENAEAVFAACDAAHGRWAKLLGVRALLHPKLRLQEFLSMHDITQEFIAATEKIGGRLGYSIRGTLQSQAKSYVDFQHESRMAKIRAVLDQERWAEVDVPDEFQAVACRLIQADSFDNDVMVSTDSNAVNANDELDKRIDGPSSSSPIRQPGDAADASAARGGQRPSPLPNTVEKPKGDSLQNSNNNKERERGKSGSQTLLYKGLNYHMVNCGLILVKILSEYIDMYNFLPALSSEVVLRVVEILKYFNSRSCQLVLGAQAMQVSGLKSITSKHLALTSQVISFIHAMIPEIRCILLMKVPDSRKAMLQLEFDRVAQDCKVHRDEIYSKLVQIMRERLLFHLRGLQNVLSNSNKVDIADAQPSEYIRLLTKEVTILVRILTRTLHQADFHLIFRQVVVIFHSQITEAFTNALRSSEGTSPEVKCRLHRDTQHILGIIRSLPTGDSKERGIANWGKLDEFLADNFGSDAV